jgi:hypothetical protein
VRAIRNPYEPEWALAATPKAPATRRWQVKLLQRGRPAFVRLVAEAGLATTDGAIGVLATGTLESRTLEQFLERMPEGTWELVCHPGYADAALKGVRTRLRESRVIEHAALLTVLPQYAGGHRELRLMHFGQLHIANAKASGN